MALLNKVIENKRDAYMINVLEESTSELESLKTKKYLTENLNMIGKILVEEGVVDAAKANLANNWGKYAAGAAGAGALGAAGYVGATSGAGSDMIGNLANKVGLNGQHIANGLYNPRTDDFVNATEHVVNPQTPAQEVVNGATRYADQAERGMRPELNQVGDKISNVANTAETKIVNGIKYVQDNAGQWLKDGEKDISNAYNTAKGYL